MFSISSCKKDKDPEPSTNSTSTSLKAEDFSKTINENPIKGQTLGSIVVTDTVGQTTFKIMNESPSGAIFMDTYTGNFNVLDSSKFDFEINPILTSVVQVVNNADTTTANITITLTDINETIPTTITTTDFTLIIPENSSGSLGFVSATTNQGTLNYSIQSQSAGTPMAINASTGELTVNNTYAFDYETSSTLTAIVAVVNGSVTETLNVTITLTDVAPTITASDYNATVPENPSVNYQNNLGRDGSITSTEGNIQYQIISQTPAGAVSVTSGFLGGRYSVNDLTTFDYEVNPVITAQVRLTVGTVTKDIIAIFTLTDVFEAITASDLPSTTIPENPVNGFVLATATATLDGGKSPRYALQSESVAGAFQVNLTNGKITVKDRSKFDYEQNISLNLTVRIKPNFTSTVFKDITYTVNLTDVANTTLEEKILDQGYTVQQALNDGHTPLELLNATVSANAIKGKDYAGGVIFRLNPTIGTGMVVSKVDLSTGATWNSAYSLAQNSNAGGFSDWRLPYKEEFNDVRAVNYSGIFTAGAPYYHWMNNAYDNIKAYAKGTHESAGQYKLKPKSSLYFARAVRNF